MMCIPSNISQNVWLIKINKLIKLTISEKWHLFFQINYLFIYCILKPNFIKIIIQNKSTCRPDIVPFSSNSYFTLYAFFEWKCNYIFLHFNGFKLDEPIRWQKGEKKRIQIDVAEFT